MAEDAEDDIETKVEDAFVKMIRDHATSEIKGIYTWAEDVKKEPAIIVKATRGAVVSSTNKGDIMEVGVLIALRHAKNGVRRGLFRIVEEAIGWVNQTPCGPSLVVRIREAAGKALTVFEEAIVGTSDKQFEEDNKIRREINISIQATHGAGL